MKSNFIDDGLIHEVCSRRDGVRKVYKPPQARRPMILARYSIVNRKTLRCLKDRLPQLIIVPALDMRAFADMATLSGQQR
jgi:hypothetical protein